MTAASVPPSARSRRGAISAGLRRLVPWVLAIAVIAALVVGGMWLAERYGTTDDTPDTVFEPATATVTRRDVVETVSWDGVLAYAGSSELAHRTSDPSGLLTAVAPAASVVEPGSALYWVNDEPVILLQGSVGLWRTLDQAVEGPDVEALETALVAMGYDSDQTVTIDSSFTSYTAAMVERFQDAVGQPVTGVIELGSVVMRPAPVRIGEHLLTVGASATDGVAVMAISASAREATISVDPATRGHISPGENVDIRLPDRTTVAGTVTTISPTVDADTGSYSTVVLADGDGGYASDQLQVTVLKSLTIADDALTVPPDALVALEGGRYQVRTLVEGEMIAVDVAVLGKADRAVAITGEGLTDGTIVLTP